MAFLTVEKQDSSGATIWPWYDNNKLTLAATEKIATTTYPRIGPLLWSYHYQPTHLYTYAGILPVMYRAGSVEYTEAELILICVLYLKVSLLVHLLISMGAEN